MVVFLAFLALFFLGFPIILALGIPAVVYVLTHGLSMSVVATKMMNSLDSYTLIAVPLFMLVGNMMGTSGLARRIFRFADKTVGWMPGGLAQVNNFASLIFAGMSGSALADIGGLGKIEMDAMQEKGFPTDYSVAVTISSATLGPIFPPSIPLILYASVASVSSVKLLIAGILPAISTMIVLMCITAVICVRRKYPTAEKLSSFQEFMGAFIPAFPALMAPVLVIVGMLVGVFTPTEAAGITIFYVFVVSIAVYREMNIEMFLTAVKDSVKASASVLAIFPAAALFSYVLTLERIPQMFTSAMLGISSDVSVLLLLMNILLLIVGMLMGNTEAIILIVPIIAPLMTSVGVDPIHLGIIIVFNLMIGLITPPYAMSLYMGASMYNVKMTSLIRQCVPYLFALLISLVLITMIPAISLAIPNLFFG